MLSRIIVKKFRIGHYASGPPSRLRFTDVPIRYIMSSRLN